MMKIKKILVFIPFFIFVFVFSSLAVSAYDFDSFYPSLSDFRDMFPNDSFINGHYYITCTSVHESNGFERCAYRCYFFDPNMGDFHIVVNEDTLNDSSGGYGSFYVVPDSGQTGLFTFKESWFEIIYNDRADNPYYSQPSTPSLYSSNYYYNRDLIHSTYNYTPNFYMSDLDVMVGDVNVNRHDYTASISYLGDNVHFQFTNHSPDITFGALCQVEDVASNMINIAPRQYDACNISLQSIKDYATYNGLDYLDLYASMTIYEGLDVVEVKRLTIREILDGEDSEDPYFSDYEDYQDFPDPDGYYDNLTPRPEMDPLPAAPDYYDYPDEPDYYDYHEHPDYYDLPEFPSFDPDSPLVSIWNIVKWIGQLIKTVFLNFVLLLQWGFNLLLDACKNLVLLIRYLLECLLTFFKNLLLFLNWLLRCLATILGNVIKNIIWFIINLPTLFLDTCLFLKDVILTLGKNIGSYFRNLVTNIRLLLTQLFVPDLSKIVDILSEKVPAFAQIRTAFQNATVSGSSLTISLLDHPVTLSCIDSLGSAGCSILYNLSSVSIYATAAFGLFNIITSIFGISINSGGDS